MAEKRLTWYRWEHRDPMAKEKWTAWTVSIYAPTYERNHVSVLLSIANGGGRCLTTYGSLEALYGRVVVPVEGRERLERGITQAEAILGQIRRDLRLLAVPDSLPPGAHLVRTDTGEIVREAEVRYDADRHLDSK